MKRCKDCKFSKLHWTDYFHYPNQWDFAKCTNPEVGNYRIDDGFVILGWLPDSGIPEDYCDIARKPYGPCRPEAKFFEEKAKW